MKEGLITVQRPHPHFTGKMHIQSCMQKCTQLCALDAGGAFGRSHEIPAPCGCLAGTMQEGMGEVTALSVACLHKVSQTWTHWSEMKSAVCGKDGFVSSGETQNSRLGQLQMIVGI